MDDGAIVALVTRLARPHPSGGRVHGDGGRLASGDRVDHLAFRGSGDAAWGNRDAGRSAWLAVYRSRRETFRAATLCASRWRAVRRALRRGPCASRRRVN
jgi:hypothetical protein